MYKLISINLLYTLYQPGSRNITLAPHLPLLRALPSKTNLTYWEISERRIRQFLQGVPAETVVNPAHFLYTHKMPHIRAVKPSILH